jgi:hypothetical protein
MSTIPMQRIYEGYLCVSFFFGRPVRYFKIMWDVGWDSMSTQADYAISHNCGIS